MDDDANYEDIQIVMSEREAVADGRPDVYKSPLAFASERHNWSTGRRRRLIYGCKDRLLLALRRAHVHPRYDLQPGVE
jgi:hypothetical protein